MYPRPEIQKAQHGVSEVSVDGRFERLHFRLFVVVIIPMKFLCVLSILLSNTSFLIMVYPHFYLTSQYLLNSV
ncbi:unnamed protein product [Schistosoma mattheei]|uniref:Uncharacterized protein n=1 Tax=Schistosoma mattheei TaxID=31246 RepID=A0AA85B1X4_9TREM|nr:unnamed protein product [Schistosoma mattheei]